jgi:mRNA-degrading endonuclease RelE of RelBE toxin-antitoxin system
MVGSACRTGHHWGRIKMQGRDMAKHEYKYTLEFRPTPLKILECLPKNLRQQIGHALDHLQRDLTGDIKKLKGQKFEYRLRVGSYRVRFELIGNHITVYDVGDRKDIYGR